MGIHFYLPLRLGDQQGEFGCKCLRRGSAAGDWYPVLQGNSVAC